VTVSLQRPVRASRKSPDTDKCSTATTTNILRTFLDYIKLISIRSVAIAVGVVLHIYIHHGGRYCVRERNEIVSGRRTFSHAAACHIGRRSFATGRHRCRRHYSVFRNYVFITRTLELNSVSISFSIRRRLSGVFTVIAVAENQLARNTVCCYRDIVCSERIITRHGTYVENARKVEL